MMMTTTLLLLLLPLLVNASFGLAHAELVPIARHQPLMIGAIKGIVPVMPPLAPPPHLLALKGEARGLLHQHHLRRMRDGIGKGRGAGCLSPHRFRPVHLSVGEEHLLVLGGEHAHALVERVEAVGVVGGHVRHQLSHSLFDVLHAERELGELHVLGGHQEVAILRIAPDLPEETKIHQEERPPHLHPGDLVVPCGGDEAHKDIREARHPMRCACHLLSTCVVEIDRCRPGQQSQVNRSADTTCHVAVRY